MKPLWKAARTVRASSAEPLLLALLVVALGAVGSAEQTPPVAPQRPVVNDYFGTKVVDPYRWMEDGKSDEFVSWLKAEGGRARDTLDAIPQRADIAQALAADYASNPNRLELMQIRGSRIFSLRRLAGKPAPILFMRDGLAGTDRPLIDPGASGDGHHHSIIEFEPSWNGRYVAYTVDTDGSESGAVRLLDVASHRDVDGAGPSVAYPDAKWLPGDSGFSYQHRDLSGTETGAHLLALHRLGTKFARDRDLLGAGIAGDPSFAPNERAELSYSPESPFAVLGIATSDAGRRRFYVTDWRTFAEGTERWRLVASIDDGVTSVIQRGNDLYVVSRDRAPHYKVLRTSAAAPDLQRAETVVPESDAILQGPGGGLPLAGYDALHAARDALYVVVLDAGNSGVLRIPWNDPSAAKRLEMPYLASVTDVASDPRVDGVSFGATGWVHAGDHFRYDPRTARVEPSGMQSQDPKDNPPDLLAEEQFVTARDGVKIPLTVIHRVRAPLDGRNPTILYGYGAYGSPLTPFLDPGQLEWYRLGGIVAIAHVRGGGEFGEAWHLAGKGADKPNTWRDAIDCAQYLIARKYTSPARLGILSASAGGIFAGRAITERPDLFTAAIINVPIVDTLRFETQGTGGGNRDEFGSVATESGFRALYEMSTYEHVRLGVRYPAILLTTGMNDRRVPPWEPAKAYARFTAATASGKPVLLRVDASTGHGIDVGEDQTSLGADWYAFLLWQFGVPGYQPRS